MRKRSQTTRIIFHHSLADYSQAEVIRKWHLERGFDDIGYHRVILKNGVVQAGRDIGLVGAHALGKNADSIGVCLEGDFRKYEPTIQQLESCVVVYHSMCRAYGIPLKIEFHRKFGNPCPGPQLDRDDFREIVSRGNPYEG